MITRPDITPAARGFLEASAGSREDENAERELAPYARQRPRSDDATVKYAMTESAAAAHAPEAEDSVSQAPARPRSGLRHRQVSTLPPPSRTRSKLEAALADAPERDVPMRVRNVSVRDASMRDSARNLAVRDASMRDSGRNPAARDMSVRDAHVPERESRPTLTPAVPARHFSERRAIFLIVLTALAAGAIGATLGNSEPERPFERVRAALRQVLSRAETRAPASPPARVVAAPPRAPPARVIAAPLRAPAAEAPPSAAPVPEAPPDAAPAPAREAVRVPVMRFQDLPRLEPIVPAPEPKRAVHTRRH